MGFKVEGIDDVMKKLDAIEVEQIAPKVLEETVPILQREIAKRTELHKVSGDMAESIKPTKPKRNAVGYYIVVRPTGVDGKGVRNMEKMVYLEYGTHRQGATPVLSPAVKEAEQPIMQKMQEVFDEEVKW